MLIIASALLPAVTFPAHAVTWTGATQVSNDSNNHYSSKVVQDQAGNVYIFWDQNPTIYYAVTTQTSLVANTGNTHLYTKLNNPDLEPAPVVLKNGTIILFFASKRNNNYDIYYSRYNGGTWSSESRLTTSPASDQAPSVVQDNTGRVWVTWTRAETGDVNIRFVDSNANGSWDPGEPIIYDTNGNGVYDSGEAVIYGTQPALGTTVKIDPKIGFVDSNGNNSWDSGEFVVYDPNLDSLYNPKFMYVDANGNNAWDQGETIIYKGNSTTTNYSGTGQCTGANPPIVDCVITGTAPTPTTVLKTDTHLKFVDLNGDGIWEPGETLVYDTNGNGTYDAGEQAVAPLTSDSKIKFIGPGANWATGNTVVYDSNGNGVYDAKIKFVDSNFNGKWDSGETVVSDNNMDGLYGLTDTVIYETTPGGDLSHQLKNDPAIKFLDSNGNGVWDIGEPVVYDSNLNSVYDGLIKFVDSNSNGVWDPGEPVVYDANNNALYDSGETVISGTTPTIGQSLKIDPKIRFFDANTNRLWDSSEPVVYDTNNNSLFDSAEPLIAGLSPAVSLGLTTGLGETPIAYGSPVDKSAVKNGAGMKYVDYNNDNVWTPGEPVVNDTNSNNIYDAGEPIIAGIAPVFGNDPKVKFVDTSNNGFWDIGESVVYDTNNNGIYDTGETVIAGATPTAGQALKTDAKIRYLDENADSVWTSGEPVIYDSNSNSLYDAGESVITGQAPLLKTDSKIRYSDLNTNNAWDSAEPVIYDANNDTQFNLVEYLVRGSVPQSGSALTVSIGEPWIGGTTAPAAGASLKQDSKLKFVDLNGNLLWNQGEPVAYDANNNNVFDTGDSVVFGSPVPTQGTALSNDEITLAGKVVANALTSDSKVKFVDANGNNSWDVGEIVVYDANNNGLYDTGEPVIAGTVPTVGQSLKSDAKLKYSEQIASELPAHWDIGESVFYDSNSNSIYDNGELVVALSQTPSTGAVLKTDSKIKYFETGTDSQWDSGESIVYDSNSNGVYDSLEPVILGPVPSVGTVLSADAKIKYVDANANNAWNPGETVVYDTNGNGVYDANERVFVSSTPSIGTPLKSVTHIFYKILTAGIWSVDQRLTVQPSNDGTPSITQTEDGRIWISWSGTRPGGPAKILQRTTVDGITWTAESPLTTSGTYGSTDPSLFQDRNGTIWLAYGRNVPCSCGQASFESDLFTNSSTNNGVNWPGSTLTSTNDEEIQPSFSQLSNKNLYIFFTDIICGGSTCTVNLYYFSTQILMHSARMNNFTVNATSVHAGQVIRLTANVTNSGDYTDTLKFYAKANSTQLGPSSSSMSSTQTGLLVINWVTIGYKGHYVLTANVTVTGEGSANFVDNYAISITVLVRPAGDVNGDCSVNIVDLVLVASSFGKTVGQAGYTTDADLNNDGIINIIDLSTVGSTFGQTC